MLSGIGQPNPPKEPAKLTWMHVLVVAILCGTVVGTVWACVWGAVVGFGGR